MPRRGGVHQPKPFWNYGDAWAALDIYDWQQDCLTCHPDRASTLVHLAAPQPFVFDVATLTVDYYSAPLYLYTSIGSEQDLMIPCCIVEGIGHDAQRGFGSQFFVVCSHRMM